MSECDRCDKYDHEKHMCPEYCKIIQHTCEELRLRGREEILESLMLYVNSQEHWQGSIKRPTILLSDINKWIHKQLGRQE